MDYFITLMLINNYNTLQLTFLARTLFYPGTLSSSMPDSRGTQSVY